MTPVVVGIGVALVGAIVVWLVAAVPRTRRAPGDGAATVGDDAEAIVAEAEAKAAEIIAAAEESRESLLAGARESAGRAAGEIRKDAKRTARAIIQESEQKAREIVAEGELRRIQAEGEVVREQELADAARRELATMVRGLLAEVEHGPGEPAENVYQFDEAQETRGTRSRSAE